MKKNLCFIAFVLVTIIICPEAFAEKPLDPLLKKDPMMMKPTFGPATIAPGQFARLNATNLGTEPAEMGMLFFDDQGEILKRTVVVIEPGMIVQSIYDPDVNNDGILFRADVRRFGGNLDYMSVITATVTYSLEIVDQDTEKTMVYIDPIPTVWH